MTAEHTKSGEKKLTNVLVFVLVLLLRLQVLIIETIASQTVCGDGGGDSDRDCSLRKGNSPCKTRRRYNLFLCKTLGRAPQRVLPTFAHRAPTDD